MEQSNGVHQETVNNGVQVKNGIIQTKEELANAEDEQRVRVYKRRWIMLGLFCVVSMSNAIQWIQYSVISNVVKDFYGVSQLAVDWFSMIYMLAYIPLILPGTWLLDHSGLRLIGILAASLNCLGAWLKFAGARPDLFGLAFTGQTVAAIAQVFILGMPAHVAATWFGAEQVSTACAIGVFGNQFGVAIGFVLPPIIVKNDDDITVVERGMKTMFLATALLTTVLLLLIILFYREKPPSPPSRAQLESKKTKEGRSYIDSIWLLSKNLNFILLLISYGINVGCYYAIGTLLNQIVLSEFPDSEVQIGIIGLALVLAGIVGSVVAGIWLDKTRTYRGTCIAVYLLSLTGMALFTASMKLDQLWIVGLVASFLGFFMTGYLPLGFEYAAELTYPESEGTSSGLLNASAQAFGIPFTILVGMVVSSKDAIFGNLILTGSLLIGSVLTACIKADLRRQRAEMQENTVNTSTVNEEQTNSGFDKQEIDPVPSQELKNEEEMVELRKYEDKSHKEINDEDVVLHVEKD
ncbi:choline/ethanolamine transporter flvcr2a-like isoform X2 [Apostichopus japonicus]|uniref:choline/ethanolamine transporter flvcr2a-like isoform X2 n=1 Tax=Stichopus japonicus TaxID=307972 RepID=UPI003AB44B78